MQCPHCNQSLRDGSKFCNTCGLSLTTNEAPSRSPIPTKPVDEHLGQQLGNYRLVRLLGEGGFARVYLGEHVHLSTQAAIKVLSTLLASSEDVDMFRLEARTIAGLNHPNIVRVLDFGVEGSAPYLVMDYATNGSLRLLHPKGIRLQPEVVWRYLRQVADALQYAHEQKLVHRDVKPENMLVGRKQEVLLTDFGIALVTQSSRYESTQGVAGTAAYMAPEQLQGRPRPASDIYSLGIVAYEWLCGERPFHGSFTEIASQHLFTPPPPLRAKVPDLPLAVEEVVLTALAKDPKERFATSRAFANAFDQAIHPGSAGVAAFSTDPSAYWTRLPGPTPLAAPTGQAIPAASTPPKPEAAPPASDAPIPTPAEPGTPLDSLGAASWHNAPTQLKPLDATEAVPPPIPDTLVEEPFLTPSEIRPKAPVAKAATPVGEAVSHFRTSGQLGENVPPLGTPLSIYHGHSGEVSMVAWVSNGVRVISSTKENTIQVWDSNSGEEHLAFADQQLIGSAGLQQSALSADRARVATLNKAHQIQVWDLESGREVVSYRGHSSRVSALAWSPDGRHMASIA